LEVQVAKLLEDEQLMAQRVAKVESCCGAWAAGMPCHGFVGLLLWWWIIEDAAGFSLCVLH